jgi:hypothetical protein
VLPAVPVTVEFAAAALPRRDPRQEDLVVIENPAPYPVRVDASLDAPLSRGLWLVKWLLLLPHYVVLAFLWLAFTVLTVVAFFAILVTGRYPRSIFDFNLGVLRWSWRVHYYGYGALGTDRYPPFTLADVPDYPAHLDVPYPERLSRGLVLVKWWLLALPHYLVVALFVGGGIWLGTGGRTTDGVWDDGWAAGGLVGLLVLIAGLVLLFSGRYPAAIYDFVLGMDRWVLRVAAYVGLMTDRYPPFRLDLGGSDPPSIPTGPAPVAPAGTGTVPAPGPAAAFAGGPADHRGARGASGGSSRSWSAPCCCSSPLACSSAGARSCGPTAPSGTTVSSGPTRRTCGRAATRWSATTSSSTWPGTSGCSIGSSARRASRSRPTTRTPRSSSASRAPRPSATTCAASATPVSTPSAPGGTAERDPAR